MNFRIGKDKIILAHKNYDVIYFYYMNITKYIKMP
jgi:hypothetical protein